MYKSSKELHLSMGDQGQGCWHKELGKMCPSHPETITIELFQIYPDISFDSQKMFWNCIPSLSNSLSEKTSTFKSDSIKKHGRVHVYLMSADSHKLLQPEIHLKWFHLRLWNVYNRTDLLEAHLKAVSQYGCVYFNTFTIFISYFDLYSMRPLRWNPPHKLQMS